MMLPHLISFISFVLLFLSLTVLKSNAQTETSPPCPISKCGNQEVKYPFWLKNNSLTQYCGYESLGLDCAPSSTSPTGHDLLLHLTPNYFHVKTISYADHTVTLVDPEVIADPACPRARSNLTYENLRGFPLDYDSRNSNLTFYFNCTAPLPFANTTSHLYDANCLTSGKNRSYVYLETNEPGVELNDDHWSDICGDKVLTAVTGETTSSWGLSFGGAMKEGFVLDWRAEGDCIFCESSGGSCGFSIGTGGFLCFCNGNSITQDRCREKEAVAPEPANGTAPPNDTSQTHEPNSTSPIEFKGGGEHVAQRTGGGKNTAQKIGIAFGFVSTVILTCLAYFLYHTQSFALILGRRTKEDQNIEAFIAKHGSVAPRRYSYSDIKKMTKSFKDELGEGGYGAVYKGKLVDDRFVAVKILNVAKGNGEEFINEVLSISRTSHVNVVMLLGFCLEGKRRALVYEYMPNGSLEKYIHGIKVDSNYLGMDKLYQISLGVARGLEYLHRGCNTRILHFDIKPHNILLDENFSPKISDFGLAKQCTNKESTVSILGARGTIGYIAPELVSRNFGGVSYKSDVYSYGMMILEIVGRRKNVNLETSHTSEIYFPHWAYQHMVVNKDLSLKGIVTPEEDEIARKIILVGLWCIQNDPLQRPTMSKVIEMLEGELHTISMPPNAFYGFPSTTPPSSSASSLMLS